MFADVDTCCAAYGCYCCCCCGGCFVALLAVLGILDVVAGLLVHSLATTQHITRVKRWMILSTLAHDGIVHLTNINTRTIKTRTGTHSNHKIRWCILITHIYVSKCALQKYTKNLMHLFKIASLPARQNALALLATPPCALPPGPAYSTIRIDVVPLATST